MTTKTVNYTDEQVSSMLADYAAGIPVASIATGMGKTVRSVIAKLSRLGVYKSPERLTKAGEPVIKKDSLADQLAMLVGLNEAEAESLTKANKTALAKLLVVIKSAKLSDANDVS